jgi:hypothetical protein
LPVRRIEIRFGKFGLVDFFDVNTYGSDSNLQFMNWTLDNNGAYDYAADTRGFTYAAMVEYDDRHWAVRFVEALMPKVANGINLDADLGRAHSENVEVELHHSLLPRREAGVCLLGYANHANMGVYSMAIDDFLAGNTPKPEITAHPLQTTTKYGFGANVEQPLTDWLGIFARESGISGPRRRRLPARRRRIELRPREQCRNLLHTSRVARHLYRTRRAIHQQPRL